MKNGILLYLFLFFALPSFADIRLPAIISSNMVLQQQSASKIWGWCEPEEKIYIITSWNNRTDSVKGNRNATWQISVPTPTAGGPYTITLKAGNTLVLENVMIGEVWICSGQSNMEMSEAWGVPAGKNELPSCANNAIRFFHIPKTTSENPQEDCKAQWVTCDTVELKSFSAVGYFFGKKLNKDLNVPIGLIESSWGGTPAEVWTPAPLVYKDEVLKNAADRLELKDGWPDTPGFCYNAMIAPVTQYNIAGAIWYQGESNVLTAGTYSQLFTTMIGAWRKTWGKSFPFYYVQIAPFAYGSKEEANLLREQQTQSMRLENTGMVVISDLVEDTTNIHPKNKHDVGLRLANWALAETYHKSGIAYKNPVYKTMETKGNKVWIHVEDGGQGLVIRGPQGKEGKGVKERQGIREIYIAGADKVFYPAEGRVEGSQLVVSSDKVKKPVAVRYEYSNAGIGNVFSTEGLPLAPFRTDDWDVSGR